MSSVFLKEEKKNIVKSDILVFLLPLSKNLKTWLLLLPVIFNCMQKQTSRYKYHAFFLSNHVFMFKRNAALCLTKTCSKPIGLHLSNADLSRKCVLLYILTNALLLFLTWIEKDDNVEDNFNLENYISRKAWPKQVLLPTLQL